MSEHSKSDLRRAEQELRDSLTYERSCEELERKVEAHNQLVKIGQWLVDARRSVLKEGPPRSQCPGCFSAIYDGAAEQGWCCDCMPKRSKYEKEAYGY